MAIIGGGYIALEFAGIYNNYGTETHVLYRQVRCCSEVEDQTNQTLGVSLYLCVATLASWRLFGLAAVPCDCNKHESENTC